MIKTFIAAMGASLPVAYLLAMNVRPAAVALTLAAVVIVGIGYLAGRIAVIDRDAARVATPYHAKIVYRPRRISRGR